jgi:hypothetical protein
MGVYHCSKVSKILQETKGIIVTDKTDSSWTFEYNGAKMSLRVLPGCCGILLVYRISGKDKIALRLLKAICQAARKAEFGLVTISLLSNSSLRKLLSPEWTTTTFQNPRTRNEVELLSYKIPIKLKPVKPLQYHEDA